MACTADEEAVGYLNDIDEKFGKAQRFADERHHSQILRVYR